MWRKPILIRPLSYVVCSKLKQSCRRPCFSPAVSTYLCLKFWCWQHLFMLPDKNKKTGRGFLDAWSSELCLSEETSSPVEIPSVRVITNRATWMASDWFQCGSTKSYNRTECQSHLSLELSFQQPIRSILIKQEEEKEQEAPSVLHWHDPASHIPNKSSVEHESSPDLEWTVTGTCSEEMYKLTLV